MVSELIERRYGIDISRWTVGRYLKAWSLSPQKPAKRAPERNPAHVSYWLKRKYPEIHRQAKEENARIWWGDETGLRSDHQTGTTWGEKGKTPVVKTSGRRFGCNMISAITNQGDLRFMVFGERFTVPVFLEFLDRLVQQQSGEKVFLIVDRRAVHKAKKVSQWLGKKQWKDSPVLSPSLQPGAESGLTPESGLEEQCFPPKTLSRQGGHDGQNESLFAKQSASASKSSAAFQRRCCCLCGRSIVKYFLLLVIHPLSGLMLNTSLVPAHSQLKQVAVIKVLSRRPTMDLTM